MTETKYGIISDMHYANPGIIVPAVKFLEANGIKRLILNGDVVCERFKPENAKQKLLPIDHLGFILKTTLDAEIEVYAQPGSHEETLDFELLVNTLAQEHKNLVNVFENPKIELPDHHLIFLPGSDYRVGAAVDAGYMLESGNLESGYYKIKSEVARVININDLKKYVTHPDKTIIVSHVPRRFNNLETGVDMAYFAQHKDGGLLAGVDLEAMIKSKFEGNEESLSREKIQEIAAQKGFTFKIENRGHEGLAKLYEQLGIRKSVTGHFHESSHRATNSKAEPIDENILVDELFWNASYMDALRMGILTVKDGKIAYTNIDLRKYIKNKDE